jgi:outer membrane phospholipase A
MRLRAVFPATAGCAMWLAGCAAPQQRAGAPPAPPSTMPSAPTTGPAAPDLAPPEAQSSQPNPNADLHQSAHHTFPSLMAHRPIYVLIGPEAPSVKFQFSTKVPLLFPGGPDEPDPVFSNIYFGYTQLSLWDIEELGKATIDTTFEPELFFATQTPPVDFQGFRASSVGLKAGVQHESNGRPGDDSRNANYFYVEPTVYFGDRKAFHGELAVKGRAFFSTMDGNPDLEDYYGHVEAFAALRFGDGLHVTVTGRLGDHPSRGAIEFDITYPLQRIRLDAYFHAQYFNGFTESLLDYNESHQVLRFGVSFVR